VPDPDTSASVQATLKDRELLIADGHHRYETARVYAQEIGGEGEHSYVLMFLCSLQDSGLTIFPTHRLLTNLKDSAVQEKLGAAIKEYFDIEKLDDQRELQPGPGSGVVMGYMDSHFKQPWRLTLKDPAIAERALADKPAPYQRLDTAVLEALILKGTLGMSDDDIDHKHGLDYSKDLDDALDAVNSGRVDAAFYMRGTPVEQVQEVADAGVSMPPKSTYFVPKIPTGLLFNALE
jgi:uncharacterized protein (DUF1015 family)